jgi:two-component system, LuxR family, sensor kinase FixL
MDFAAVAHDLRAPLHAMLGHTQLLAVERLSDAGRHRLEIIEAQIQRMAALIDGCLPQPARGMPMTPIDLKETIDDVLAELEGMLPRRGIQVVTIQEERLPLVAGERADLHRVLVNLFVNAADAMPGGGRIVVRTRTERRPLGAVTAAVIDITDTGTGIPPELVPRVFERGFTTKQQGEGTGLGLAICREIVEAHGGQIELSTLPAQGTTVRISLPVAAAQSSEHAA